MTDPKKAGAKPPAPQSAPTAEQRRHRLLQAIIDGDEEADPFWAEGRGDRTLEQIQAQIREANNDRRRRSWVRLQDILRAALEDRAIKANPDARDFVYVLLHLAYTAKRDSTVEDMGRRINVALAKLRADDQHGNTRKLRAMVREHYQSKADEFDTKAQFAREYSRLLKEEFGYVVTTKEISDRWLKGLKAPPH